MCTNWTEVTGIPSLHTFRVLPILVPSSRKLQTIRSDSCPPVAGYNFPFLSTEKLMSVFSLVCCLSSAQVQLLGPWFQPFPAHIGLHWMWSLETLFVVVVAYELAQNGAVLSWLPHRFFFLLCRMPGATLRPGNGFLGVWGPGCSWSRSHLALWVLVWVLSPGFCLLSPPPPNFSAKL